ncbi:UbiH/UbiF family hydroxylase [soil metagenome]
MNPYDVCVRGAGAVGHALALSLARQGLRVALQARPREPATGESSSDIRAFAVNRASVALLQDLKVWNVLEGTAATAGHDMHIEGDAPGASIDFSSWQQRVGALAWIVDAAALESELASAARFSPHITAVSPEVAVDASLTAICEGRDSYTRDKLNVHFERNDYGHRAIAARLVAPQSHMNVARQWFRAPDVLALLPFDQPEPDRSYALVWSVPDARATELMAMEPADFEQQLFDATGGACGELKLTGSVGNERAAWPLMLAKASRWCGPGWVLLGDAAHVVHPLAGQGLNLGLADVSALTKVVAARESWRPLGDERLLRRYERERLAPTWAMGAVTDGLLRLFASQGASAKELRNRGLTLVDRLTPLKRWLTSHALDS